MASIYQRGKVLWGKWSQDGSVIRQSLGTRDKAEARRVLKERMSQGTQRGGIAHVLTSTITWDTAAQDLLVYYEAYQTRNPHEAGIRLRQLTKYWRGSKLSDIDASSILDDVSHQRRDGKAPATINLDLATLRRALRLAHENGKLEKVPRIRMLRPDPPRSGFFEREKFEAAKAQLPDDLTLAVSIGFVFGWRVHSEALTLTKAQIDLVAGTLRLAPGSTKNRDGRLVYLTAELKAGIADQLVRVRALERTIGEITPYLFPHLSGPYRGQRIKGFRKMWAKACREAGCAGMLVHDLRRTAVRNMVNAGVSERVAMMITGHKTRMVFDRYHIVSPDDLREATRKLSDKAQSNQAHSSGERAVSG